MPLPLAPLAIAAAPGIINGISQIITNNQQKKFAQQQYATQRADNLKDWERQNQYNSPIAQMTRLSEAGLNPNLIYKGGATNQAGEVSRAQFGSYNPQAPKFEMDIADTLNKFQNYKNQQLQADNLKQNLQISKAQEELIKANTLNKLKDTDVKAFNIFKGNTLLGYQADAAKLGLRNIEARTEYTIDQNKRGWILAANKPEETLARIALMRAQTSKVPFETEVLKQNAQKLRTENYYLGTNLTWKNLMNKELHQNLVNKNFYYGDSQRIQNGLNEMRKKLIESEIPLKYADRFIKLVGEIIPF